LRVGYGLGYINSTLRLGQPEFSSYDGAVGALQLRYVRYHTNDAVIPTQGHYIRLNFRWFDNNPGATEAFPSMELHAGYYHPVSSKGSFFLNTSGGSTFGVSHVGTPQSSLAGRVN
jgi:outer membrane protein assembly factor BamA